MRIPGKQMMLPNEEAVKHRQPLALDNQFENIQIQPALTSEERNRACQTQSGRNILSNLRNCTRLLTSIGRPLTQAFPWRQCKMETSHATSITQKLSMRCEYTYTSLKETIVLQETKLENLLQKTVMRQGTKENQGSAITKSLTRELDREASTHKYLQTALEQEHQSRCRMETELEMLDHWPEGTEKIVEKIKVLEKENTNLLDTAQRIKGPVHVALRVVGNYADACRTFTEPANDVLNTCSSQKKSQFKFDEVVGSSVTDSQMVQAYKPWIRLVLCGRTLLVLACGSPVTHNPRDILNNNGLVHSSIREMLEMSMHEDLVKYHLGLQAVWITESTAIDLLSNHKDRSISGDSDVFSPLKSLNEDSQGFSCKQLRNVKDSNAVIEGINKAVGSLPDGDLLVTLTVQSDATENKGTTSYLHIVSVTGCESSTRKWYERPTHSALLQIAKNLAQRRYQESVFRKSKLTQMLEGLLPCSTTIYLIIYGQLSKNNLSEISDALQFGARMTVAKTDQDVDSSSTVSDLQHIHLQLKQTHVELDERINQLMEQIRLYKQQKEASNREMLQLRKVLAALKNTIKNPQVQQWL